MWQIFLFMWQKGSIIMDKKKILERLAQYIRELFEDNRKEHDVMKKNSAGPPVMKDEVREAMRKMKKGKANGPDGLSIELIEALEEYGIEKVTTLLNEIYDTGQIIIIIIIMKIIYIASNPLKGSRRFTKSVTATLQFT